MDTRKLVKTIGLLSATAVFTVLTACGGGGGGAGGGADAASPFSSGSGTQTSASGGAQTAGATRNSPSGDNQASTQNNADLTLAWKANPGSDHVNRYNVYYGKTPNPDNMRKVKDSNVASVQINTWNDLRLLAGQSVCFRVKAESNTALSDFSTAVCTTI